jgi:plasmid stabilization system protein ParE
MRRFRVEVTNHAAESIDEYRRYIAEQSGSPKVASNWTDAVYNKIDLLRYMPTRFAIASEGARCSYKVRRLLIGKYIALYHVDENTETVHVLAFRHGARLPRPEDLPKDPPV